MVDQGSLLNAASFISGFGVAVFVFRLQREINLAKRWIPPADWLVIADRLAAQRPSC